MLQFVYHPAFRGLWHPETSAGLGSPYKHKSVNAWVAAFLVPGHGRLNAQPFDLDLRMPNCRLITAASLPELVKRCDEFLRVYDTEIAGMAK